MGPTQIVMLLVCTRMFSTLCRNWQSLLVDFPPEGRVEQQGEKDHAEVDLPVAGSILGGESIFLQVVVAYVLALVHRVLVSPFSSL